MYENEQTQLVEVVLRDVQTKYTVAILPLISAKVGIIVTQLTTR